MTKQAPAPEPTLKIIDPSGRALPRVDARAVAAALGAEVTTGTVRVALAPITLLAVREELLLRLQSSGGRPGLADTTRRAKVPLGDKEWFELEELAATISSPGFSPSAGQVASVLLSLSIRSVTAQLSQDGGKNASSVVGDLAHLAREGLAANDSGALGDTNSS